MIDFFASLSVFGWLLIVLLLATLWQIKPIIHMILYRSREGRWPIPGEDPPASHGPGRGRGRGRGDVHEQGSDSNGE